MTDAKPVWPTTQLALKERRDEGDGIYTYIFTPAERVEFIAGQYCHLRASSLPETTRRTREISFASTPREADIQFGIDARSGSDYQKALTTLPIGGAVELFKVKGHMTWPTQSAHAVMIAGGIGITPFRSMLLDARERGLPTTSTLIYASSGLYLYDEELKGVASEYVKTNRAGLESELSRVAAAHQSAHYYVAGSPGFVAGVVSSLQTKAVERIESDEFKGIPDTIL